MRRLLSPTPLVLALVAGSCFAGLALAQEATPPPAGFEMAPGVTAEAVAFAPGAEEPALYRLRFAPGAIYPFAEDPSLGLVLVESGTLRLRVDAPLTVGQLGATDWAAAAIAAGTEVTVAAGDDVVLRPLVTGEVRNEGQAEAVVTVAGIVPSATAAPVAGTPVP